MENRFLFRGKRLHDGKWVQGDLTTERICGSNLIFTGIDIDNVIEPKTIGQYTGLQDKNGRFIFEGDILSCPIIRNGGQHSNWEREINKNHGKQYSIHMQMEWIQDSHRSRSLGEWKFTKIPNITDFQIKEIEKPTGKERMTQNVNYFNIKPTECEIIGTIHDNV